MKADAIDAFPGVVGIRKQKERRYVRKRSCGCSKNRGRADLVCLLLCASGCENVKGLEFATIPIMLVLLFFSCFFIS